VRKDAAEALAHFTSPAPSMSERKAAGKALREKLPRERHAEFTPGRRRPDPVAILEKQAESRVPSLVPLRYARMLASPFSFLRGAAAVMAADLARTPVTGLTVQACGDMHLANFGVYASAERNLVFGINDFDETLPGPWEWDLKRLAASAVVSVRFMGGDRVLCEEAARAAVASYRTRIREYAGMGHLGVWYSRIGEGAVLHALPPETRKIAERITSKARRQGNLQLLGKMTELSEGRPRIVERPPDVVRETRLPDGRPVAEVIGSALALYRESLPAERRQLLSRYRVADVARKVVGVGSVGTRCWVVLMTGNGPDDPLFLQYKEAQPSVLAPWSKTPSWDNEGERVVVGQRLIQGAPDIFLGWGRTVEGIHFYMRQLRDMKGGVAFEPENVTSSPAYLGLCGWALALAHARSGDPALLAGYVGKSEVLDEAVTRFAFAYAEQTERDHEALARAARAGRIEVAETA
jgi:uncharacterized protein (DUF2252 family)